MKRLLFLLLLLGLAVWAGLAIRQDPGYILIAYRTWTMEMPVWAGVLTLVIGFILFYNVIQLISVAHGLSNRLHAWFLRRRKRLSRNRTSQGLIELAEGHWGSAESNLLRAVSSSETPLINYLAAAWAAQEQHKYEQRNEYLRLAYQTTPDAEIAIGVVQAQLQLNHQQWEHALATLRRMLELSPKHRYVLRLLKDVYLQLNDWFKLGELLPQLRKTKTITVAEAEVLQRIIYRNELIHAINHAEKDVLNTYWKSLPKLLQLDSEFLKFYIPAIIHDENNLAELVIRDALKKKWDVHLVKWYGMAPSLDTNKQLAVAESWLRTYPQEPTLLLTTGRLCLKNQLWGKARSYLELSVQLDPRPETYLLLGELATEIDSKATATDYYHHGLSLAVNKAAEINYVTCTH